MTIVASMKTERRIKINLLKDFRIKITPEIKDHIESISTTRELDKYAMKLINQKLDSL